MTSPLNPYDTDTVYEPQLWVDPGSDALDDAYGKVDFDNGESTTVLTLLVRPDDEGARVIDVSIAEGDRVQLVVNGRTVWFGVAGAEL